MTVPNGLPPDRELLAALDADLLDPDEAAAVRAAALADPAATAVLAALAATRADLAALPVPAVPPGVADRWTAALDAEAARRGTPAVRKAAGRRRPERRTRGPALTRRPLAAAAVLVAAVAGVLVARQPEPAAGVLSLTRVELAALGSATMGVNDLGALADPMRRAGCLSAVAPIGANPTDHVLGGRRVLLDGQAGVLLVLATGVLGRFRLVVVDPACGPSGGTLLADTVVGS